MLFFLFRLSPVDTFYNPEVEETISLPAGRSIDMYKAVLQLFLLGWHQPCISQSGITIITVSTQAKMSGVQQAGSQ